MALLPCPSRKQGTRHHLDNFIPELLAATSTKCLKIYRNATQSYC